MGDEVEAGTERLRDHLRGTHQLKCQAGSTVYRTLPSAPASDAAQSRLRERYAAGEIDDEEYERRLSALTYWH